MKVKEIKYTKINRSLSFFGDDSIACDVCTKPLVKDDMVYKAKVYLHQYCTTAVYVCPSCYTDEGVFLSAISNRVDLGQSLLDNAAAAK